MWTLIIKFKVFSKKNLILVYIGVIACVTTHSCFADVVTSDERLGLAGYWLHATRAAQWLWILSASTLRLGLGHNCVAYPLVVLACLRTLVTFKGRLGDDVRLWKHLDSFLRRFVWLMLRVIRCWVHAHKLVLTFLLRQLVKPTLYYSLFRGAVESSFLVTRHCLRVKLLGFISKWLLLALHHFSNMWIRYKILWMVL